MCGWSRLLMCIYCHSGSRIMDDKGENTQKSKVQLEKNTTSRPKDVQHHKQWLQVLLSSKAAPNKDKSKNKSPSKKSEHSNGLFALKSRRKQLCQSLTNLSDVEEKNASLGKKTSRTLDNRYSNVPNVKSGSADDILDRITNKSDSSSSADEDICIEEKEDGGEEISNMASFIKEDIGVGTPRSPEYSLQIDQIDSSSSTIDEEETIKNLSHTDEVVVDVCEGKNAESNFLRCNSDETTKSKYNIRRISETKLGQIREGKLKTKNFFSKKDSKRSDEPSTSEKVSKKTKSSKSTPVDTCVPHAKSKGNLKSKYEQVSKRFTFTKDEVLLEQSGKDRKQRKFSNDKIGKDENLQIPQDSTSLSHPNVNNLEEKPPKKEKNWRGNRRSNDFGHQNVELRNNAKMTESDEVQLYKRKKKKISFLSKMLKSKKNESFEERGEKNSGVNIDQNAIDNYIPSESYSLSDEHTEKPSTEERNPSIVIHKVNFVPMAFPISALNDELKKKFQSRVTQLEIQENPSSGMNVSSKSSRKPPLPVPRLRNESTSVPAVIHNEAYLNDKQEDWRPSLPPRTFTRRSKSPNGDNPSMNNSSPFEAIAQFDESYSRGIGLTERLSTYSKGNHNTQVQKRNDYDHVQLSGRNNWPNVKIKDAHSLVKDTEPHSNISVQHVLSGWNESHLEERLVSGFNHENDSLFREEKLTPVSSVAKDTGFISVVNLRNSALPDKFLYSADAEISYNEGTCDHIHGNSQINLPLEKGTKRVERIDELGLLLNELDRINSSPLENTSNSTNSRPMSEEIKAVSIFNEDVMAAFPIRRRRNSDPDYDVPRPHRLPLTQTIDSGSNDESHSLTEIERDDDYSGRQGTDSIVIEATCFFGPGMDYCFDKDRYFCLNENTYKKNKKDDVHTTAMDYTLQSGDLKRNDNYFNEEIDVCDEISLNPDMGIEKKFQVEILETKIADECDEEKVHGGDNSLALGDEDNGVVLRVKKVDRCFRHERSREVCEDDLVDIPALAASMEDLSVSRTRQEEVGKFNNNGSEVVLRQKPASESGEFRRDNKTLRLSFATTETLIVEEEVLVATLKTTTTTTTTSAIDFQTSTQKVEEFIDEVVLDMDNLADDHFGSMEVQSCVQT